VSAFEHSHVTRQVQPTVFELTAIKYLSDSPKLLNIYDFAPFAGAWVTMSTTPKMGKNISGPGT